MVDLEAREEADQMLMFVILVAKNIEIANAAGLDLGIETVIGIEGVVVLVLVHAIASAHVVQGQDRETAKGLVVTLVLAQETDQNASAVTEAIVKKVRNGVRLGLRMNPRRMAMAITMEDEEERITDSRLKSRLSKTMITSLLVPAMAVLGISRCLKNQLCIK